MLTFPARVGAVVGILEFGEYLNANFSEKARERFYRVIVTNEPTCQWMIQPTIEPTMPKKQTQNAQSGCGEEPRPAEAKAATESDTQKSTARGVEGEPRPDTDAESRTPPAGPGGPPETPRPAGDPPGEPDGPRPDMAARLKYYWSGRTMFALFTLISSLIFTVGFPLAHSPPRPGLFCTWLPFSTAAYHPAWYWGVLLSLGVTIALFGIPDLGSNWNWRTPFELTWYAREPSRPVPRRATSLIFRGLLVFTVFTGHAAILALSFHGIPQTAALYPTGALYATLVVLLDRLLVDVLCQRVYEMKDFKKGTPEARKEVLVKDYDLRSWAFKTMVQGFLIVPVAFCWVAAQHSWDKASTLTPGTIWGMVLATCGSIGLLLGVLPLLHKLNEDALAEVLRLPIGGGSKSTGGGDDDEGGTPTAAVPTGPATGTRRVR